MQGILVARLQLGVRGKFVCNSSELKSLSASLSHLRKLTGHGLTEELGDGIANGYLGVHVAFKQRPYRQPERIQRTSGGDNNNGGQSQPTTFCVISRRPMTARIANSPGRPMPATSACSPSGRSQPELRTRASGRCQTQMHVRPVADASQCQPRMHVRSMGPMPDKITHSSREAMRARPEGDASHN